MARVSATGLIATAVMVAGGCALEGKHEGVTPVAVVGAPDSASQREYGCLASRMLDSLAADPGSRGYENKDPVLLIVDGIPLGRVHRIARDCPEREELVLGRVEELKVMLPPNRSSHDPDAKNGMVVIETR